MSTKDIAVFMFSPTQDEAALVAGEAMARSGDADIAAVLLQIEPEPVYTMEGMMMISIWAEVMSEAKKGLTKQRAALEARAKTSERRIAVRELILPSGVAAQEAAVHARHADLSIMLRPGEMPSTQRMEIFEGVLFGSGRPVLIVPPTWNGAQIGKKVMVAWNGKRESARALADAAPLLDAADEVVVLTIDAKPSADGHGAAPGADIAAHLARRGLNVEVRNIDGLGRDEADALIAEAQNAAADLIVMGGYGRARMSEMVFGGMTRDMVQKSPLPIFMSH